MRECLDGGLKNSCLSGAVCPKVFRIVVRRGCLGGGVKNSCLGGILGTEMFKTVV